MKTVREDRSYLIEDETRLQSFIDVLNTRFLVSDTEKSTLRITYLDTFDWRVWRQGGVLEYAEKKRSRKLRWRAIDNRQVYVEFPVEECPDFINDISDWLLPEKLFKITRPRCLMEQASSRVDSQDYEILDGSEKVIARMRLVKENMRYANNRSGQALAIRLEIINLRGYEKEFSEITAAAKQAGLAEYAKDPLLQLLHMNDRRPCDYSMRLKLQIDSQQRVDRVSKQILLQLLNIMQQNEPGICNDMDTEFLHDFRHALHRSHSLVSQLKNILPVDTLTRFDKDLVWLEHETRYLYELNNWLLDFQDICKLVPARQRDRLDLLLAWLREQRHAELLRVVAILQGQHYQKFSKRWRVFLDCEVPEHTVLKYAARPVYEIAGIQLWKTYKRLSHYNGDQLGDPEQLDTMHRQSRVLYDLLEFSRSMYTSDSVNKLLKLNSRFLEELRKARQAHHRVKSLRGFIQTMRGEGRLEKTAQKTMKKLMQSLEAIQTECENNIATPYQKLTESKVRQAFRQSFKADA